MRAQGGRLLLLLGRKTNPSREEGSRKGEKWRYHLGGRRRIAGLSGERELL